MAGHQTLAVHKSPEAHRPTLGSRVRGGVGPDNSLCGLVPAGDPAPRETGCSGQEAEDGCPAFHCDREHGANETAGDDAVRDEARARQGHQHGQQQSGEVIMK